MPAQLLMLSSHASSFSILAAVRSPGAAQAGGQQFQRNDGVPADDRTG